MRKKRETPITIEKEEFKQIGSRLIDTIAQFYDKIDNYPVSMEVSPIQLQNILGSAVLPKKGISADETI